MSCTRMKKEDVLQSRDYQGARDYGWTRDPGRSPKKGISLVTTITKAFDSFKNVGRSKTPPPQRASNGPNVSSYLPVHQAGPIPLSRPIHHSGPIYQPGGGPSMTLPPIAKQEDTRNQPASSSHGDRNDSRDTGIYQIRAPPPGSYQDDDTGPSPKNLVMAVMGVKGAVNHFAKALISDMNKYPKELRRLKQTILREVQGQVDRPNHWKFLVQAFVCKRLFEGFETENGFFGIKYFDGLKMTPYNSFADFSKFKDKAATISGLLAMNSADASFLGRFCFKKFMSITGDLDTNQPLRLYEVEWSMVGRERHPPQSEFYQSFLKVAVSVWLLHRLVYSFEQGWKMLGWETFPKGCKFQKTNMESVVPGGFEEDDDETGTDVNTVVGFLVIPGFQVSKSVVKCEVYLRNQNSINDGKIMDASEMLSREKGLEKSHSDKTPASYQTPEKSLSDRSLGSLETPDSFRSSSNYNGHSSRAAFDEETSRNFWSAPQIRENLGNASGRSRIVQGRSPGSKSGHLESNDRAQTSKHYLPTPEAHVSARQPKAPEWSVLRHTKSSKLREDMHKRPSYTR